MARNEPRPDIDPPAFGREGPHRSTAGTGYTYVTRENRRNDPERPVLRRYDPVVGRHVDFREGR
ncbi:50S ribosomal protein L33 [Kitasatospora sp. RB6PN24]|uniref:50S ribosomal protein L33 n=1 Tax=Kitasatospora humi TaxID=2893891 RepID=UPI001E3AEF9B|nr:50S ribosomal protein L33 [Kitasatospora humi]MCC9306120.1 50S ribosomal protein L33 [Kitasatospora humi]